MAIKNGNVCDVHGVLEEKRIRIHKSRAHPSCALCENARARIYYSQNREKSIERCKEYSRNNREKLNEYAKKRYSKNKDRILKKNSDSRKRRRQKDLILAREKDKVRRIKNKEMIRNINRKHRLKRKENLTDSYIRLLLIKHTSLKAADIPQELIEIKRIELQIKKELNNMENT